MSTQNNWRWCNKCQALSFAGNATPGKCPAGGEHNHAGSGDYVMINNEPSAPGQSNWRWCNKCQAMSFAGNPTLGACSAGGLHDHAGSGNYTLVQTAGAPGQANWRWCNKCEVLAFAGSPTIGACAAGGVHNHTGSGNYVLTQMTDSVRLALNEQHQLQDEWCWSATTVSITKFYDPASSWTQCLLVNKAFGQSTCCQNGSSSACNQPWYPDKALTITDHLASTAGGVASLATVKSQINGGHPISIAIYWNGGGGHNPAIAGYNVANPAAPTIDIQDPWYGPTVNQDYNTFPGTYNGGASWGMNYFTK